MTAVAVPQRVMIPNKSSWLAWRAVCDAHEVTEYLIPSWQASETHRSWFDATLDAKRHNLEQHPKQDPSWDQLMLDARDTAEQLSTTVRSTRGRVLGGGGRRVRDD